ncbi:class I SAM-dependent methyltransferase [Bacillus salacetis]|uniref:Class I SAM-dependent methyltransferase n=1 Tax=Bacillus salacetis TaxID=2315464 RepID=A0A3A1QVJ5_9BACI|nr:class I SAM-dependent methyltransferase [Bacillus salacetis]RIW32024.1 class I SAM-dependent methyltransferase [Bacillus salacetis]
MITEFHGRSRDYAIGRPSYPREILQLLKEKGINERCTIADIGAGTGLLTKILAETGSQVLAIEPNGEMLKEGRDYCFYDNNIEFVHAAAEETGLKDNSVDLITIAQAFHWFDKKKCKVEFQRILKEDGCVMIVFNEMRMDGRLPEEYTGLLHRFKVKENAGISDLDPDEEKMKFFGKAYTKSLYDYEHTLTEEAFVGGALSLSYTPSKTDERYGEFIEALRQLYKKHEQEGMITLRYKTEVCLCGFSKENFSI